MSQHVVRNARRITSPRVVRVMAISALATAGLVLVAAPAGAATTVTTEAEFRAAWSDPNESEVVLGGDITLTDCEAGTPERSSGQPLTLNGNGHVITQTCPNEGVLTNGYGALTVDGVTITGGHSPEEPLSSRGGGLRTDGPAIVRNSAITGNIGLMGGGIDASNGLEIINSEISGNTARVNGGGIAAAGAVDIVDSTITDNVAVSFGGGVAAFDDGYPTFSGAHLHITNSLIAGNHARNGGGAHAFGSLDVTDSVFRGNTAEYVGGGLVGIGVVTASGTTVENNTAGLSSGGLGAGETLLMQDSVVRNNTAFNGGGIWVPGNETDSASVVVTESEISDNAAYQGGGIFSTGDLTVLDSRVIGNAADGSIERPASVPGNDDDEFPLGGGIYGDRVSIHDSTVNGNSAEGTAASSAGIFASQSVALVRSSVSENASELSVGGLFAGESVTMTDSTIGRNSAAFAGGGAVSFGDMTLVNSTVTANVAAGGRGGVLALGNLTLVYSTIVANSANDDANITSFGPLTSIGSVVARPLGGGTNCGFVRSTQSHGWNATDDTSCGFDAATDLQDVDPLLGELDDNGGPTETLLPAPDSPLVDAIPLEDCQTNGAAGITTDQRGETRPSGIGCDIGAVELAQVTYTVRYDEGTCTALHTFADAIGTSVADVIKTGVTGFVDLAEAGQSTPGTPPVNAGLCEIAVSWPVDEVDGLEDAAAAWGVDIDQLHHGGGRLILTLLWIAIVNGD